MTDVITIDLNNMSEEDLIQMIKSNNLGPPQLMPMLASLFEVWSRSLRLSCAALNHAENHFPGFLEQFIKEMGKQHGTPKEEIQGLIDMVRNFHNSKAMIH